MRTLQRILHTGIQLRRSHAVFLPGARRRIATRVATEYAESLSLGIIERIRDPFLRPLTWAAGCFARKRVRKERGGTNCPRERTSAESFTRRCPLRV